jgi:hypothetical protein
MILLVIKNKLAKKLASCMPGYTTFISKFSQKNPTSLDQAYGHGTSSKINEPLVNHLKSLGTQKCSMRVDGP